MCISFVERRGAVLKHSRIILSALTVLLGTSGVAQAQMNMKPGLWETKIIRMNVDGQDMLAQMSKAQEQMRQAFAKMPPEQRKKMEAMIPNMGGDMMTQRICVTPDMAGMNGAMPPARSECAPPKLNRSGNRVNFEMTCKQGTGQMVAKGETILNGDQISSKMNAVTTESSGKKRTMQNESQMKFISGDCGKVKPIDQFVSEIKSQLGVIPDSSPGKK